MKNEKKFVVYFEVSTASKQMWWNYSIENVASGSEAIASCIRHSPSIKVTWVEEWSEQWRDEHPATNPTFTEWAKARMAAASTMMDESLFPKSASAEDKPVRKFKVPDLPLEVFNTVEFDPIKAWAATKAASEGQ